MEAKYEAMSVRVHIYEVRPRKDKRGVDLISNALLFGRLWYAGLNAISTQSDTQSHVKCFQVGVPVILSLG